MSTPETVDYTKPITRSANVETKWPFKRSKLLSNQEMNVFDLLFLLLPDKIIIAKVHVARILDVVDEYDPYWFEAIMHMAADFVICDSTTGKAIAVIELIDTSLHPEKRKLIDKNMHKALLDAGIKVFQWKSSELPSRAAIETAFS